MSKELDMIQMQKLRATEIEILDYIVSVCDEFGLHYYLLYGTLLGAVRHKGFIPWDDDIDIGLPRQDYNILCNILKKCCNGGDSSYFYQSIETERGFRLPFSKLRKNGTVFLEREYEDKNIHNGIFVDIFPLDKAKRIRGLQKPFSFLIYKLYKYAGKWNVSLFLKTAKCFITYYEDKNCLYYVSYGSPYPVERDIVDIEWFGEGTYCEFEGKQYRIPLNPDAYLQRIYGEDFRKLPPEEERKTHSPSVLKFHPD